MRDLLNRYAPALLILVVVLLIANEIDAANRAARAREAAAAAREAACLRAEPLDMRLRRELARVRSCLTFHHLGD